MGRAGRKRYLESTAIRIHAALQVEHLSVTPAVTAAFGASARALVTIIATLNTEITTLQGEVDAYFGRHPDNEIYLSQPGLGVILAGRVLAEFGDDTHRYATGKARRNYAGISPITRASGTRTAVLARYSRTGASVTRYSNRPSRHSPHRPAPAPTTTPCEPAASATTTPYAAWPTDSSASSTAAYATTSSRTKPPPGPDHNKINKPSLDNLRPRDV